MHRSRNKNRDNDRGCLQSDRQKEWDHLGHAMCLLSLASLDCRGHRHRGHRAYLLHAKQFDGQTAASAREPL